MALLCFQFNSHAETWGAPSKKVSTYNPDLFVGTALASVGANLAATAGGAISGKIPIVEVKKEDKPFPVLSQSVMVMYLLVIVVLTAFCTKFALDSIDSLSQEANISKSFIGLILLPILNNDSTPIHHAVMDNMHHTMDFTNGKRLQTALFVSLLMALIAWGMHLELTLNFDGFEVVSLFASVLLLNYLIIDGKSSW